MGLEEHEPGPSSEAPFSGLRLRVQGGRAVSTVAHFSLENMSALIFWCRKSGHKDLPDCLRGVGGGPWLIPSSALHNLQASQEALGHRPPHHRQGLRRLKRLWAPAWSCRPLRARHTLPCSWASRAPGHLPALCKQRIRRKKKQTRNLKLKDRKSYLQLSLKRLQVESLP